MWKFFKYLQYNTVIGQSKGIYYYKICFKASHYLCII